MTAHAKVTGNGIINGLPFKGVCKPLIVSSVEGVDDTDDKYLADVAHVA